MLDALSHVILVAEHGTFTEAARRAHLSQPALSASIARLEGELGAALFERGAGGARLTAAGKALLPRARAALAAVEEGRRAVGEVLGLVAGEVRLGGGATVCTYYLPSILARFRRAHPGLLLKLLETTTAGAETALAAGELDLAIVTDPAGEPWRDDELVIVSAPDARPARLAEASWVTFPRGATTRDILERTFRNPRVVMELSGIAAVLAFARAGAGVALVSRVAVAGDLARGSLLQLPHAHIVRRLSLVHRGVDRLPPAASALRLALLADRGRPVPGPSRAPSKRRAPSGSSRR